MASPVCSIRGCSTSIPRNGYCPPHKRIYERQARVRKAARGICVRCKEFALPGLTTCPFHAATFGASI